MELTVQLKGNNTHCTAFAFLLCESKLQKKKSRHTLRIQFKYHFLGVNHSKRQFIHYYSSPDLASPLSCMVEGDKCVWKFWNKIRGIGKMFINAFIHAFNIYKSTTVWQALCKTLCRTSRFEGAANDSQRTHKTTCSKTLGYQVEVFII